MLTIKMHPEFEEALEEFHTSLGNGYLTFVDGSLTGLLEQAKEIPHLTQGWVGKALDVIVLGKYLHCRIR